MMLTLYIYFLIAYAIFFFLLGYVTYFKYETVKEKLAVSAICAILWPITILYVLYHMTWKL